MIKEEVVLPSRSNTSPVSTLSTANMPTTSPLLRSARNDEEENGLPQHNNAILKVALTLSSRLHFSGLIQWICCTS